MSEHVSVELGKRLAEAGLMHTEWRTGDWAVHPEKPDWLMLIQTTKGGILYWYDAQHTASWWTQGRHIGVGAELVWLPTAGQCLEALHQLGGIDAGALANYCQWVVVPERMASREYLNGSLAEAAGLALAAVLEERP